MQVGVLLTTFVAVTRLRLRCKVALVQPHTHVCQQSQPAEITVRHDTLSLDSTTIDARGANGSTLIWKRRRNLFPGTRVR
jgi:hypothetical protein